METSAKKLIATLALATILLVSLVSICKQTLATCGFNCFGQPMSAMPMAPQMESCAQNNATCPIPMQDHMAIFSTMYSAVATDAASLIVIVSVAFLVSWFLISKDDCCELKKVQSRLRSIKYRFAHSITFSFLIFAFRHGILNSKKYA